MVGIEGARDFRHTFRKVVGTRSLEKERGLAMDALLARILLDFGLVDEVVLAEAAADRDRTGLLLEHVLHTSYGIPIDDLLRALSERRRLIAQEMPDRRFARPLRIPQPVIHRRARLTAS